MRHGIFGIHSVCLYDLKTGIPFTMMQILGECSVNFSAEFADLLGGSQMFPYDSEISSLKSEISMTAREYSSDVMEKFLGGVKTGPRSGNRRRRRRAQGDIGDIADGCRNRHRIDRRHPDDGSGEPQDGAVCDQGGVCR